MAKWLAETAKTLIERLTKVDKRLNVRKFIIFDKSEELMEGSQSKMLYVNEGVLSNPEEPSRLQSQLLGYSWALEKPWLYDSSVVLSVQYWYN